MPFLKLASLARISIGNWEETLEGISFEARLRPTSASEVILQLSKRRSQIYSDSSRGKPFP